MGDVKAGLDGDILRDAVAVRVSLAKLYNKVYKTREDIRAISVLRYRWNRFSQPIQRAANATLNIGRNKS